MRAIRGSRIFEPKFTTKNSGMGLGLGIIKNIIENYNGTITFETALGKGTVFCVFLPIIQDVSLPQIRRIFLISL